MARIRQVISTVHTNVQRQLLLSLNEEVSIKRDLLIFIYLQIVFYQQNAYKNLSAQDRNTIKFNSKSGIIILNLEYHLQKYII